MKKSITIESKDFLYITARCPHVFPTYTIMLALVGGDGFVWSTNEQISEASGVPVATVRRHIRSMCDHGIIERKFTEGDVPRRIQFINRTGKD